MKVDIDTQKKKSTSIELKEGKKIALSEVDTDERLSSYKGHQVLLYIREHGEDVQAALEDGSEGRRFHLTFCRTLKEMKRDALEFYVATSDFSGEFHIMGVDPETSASIEGKTDLNPCQNCLVELGLKRPTEEIFREYLSLRSYRRRPYSRRRTRFEHLGLDPSLKKLLERWRWV